MTVFHGLVQYSWAVCLSVCSKYSIQFYHLLRHSCRIGSFTMKIDWRDWHWKENKTCSFVFHFCLEKKKRQKKRCWNPQKGLAFHTAKRSVSRSGDRSQKSPFTNGLSDDKSTLGSWLLRISLVWFSLVHIFKKIAQTAYVVFTCPHFQKNSTNSLCDFHYTS